MSTPVQRPNPIGDALRAVGPAIAGLLTIVTGLGSAGILSVAQTSAIESYAGEVAAATAPTGPISLGVGAVIGLVTGGGALLGMFRAGRNAGAEATPVSDPRDRDGTPLVRPDGQPLGGGITVPHGDPATEAIRPGDPYVG